jgi:hypothetical protein
MLMVLHAHDDNSDPIGAHLQIASLVICPELELPIKV